MLFPFAPFLVKFLLPDVKETDVGESVMMHWSHAQQELHQIVLYKYRLSSDHDTCCVS